MKSLTPAQSLLLLLLVGLAISGWFYGIHWKRVASGDLFSSDEKLMVRLQDQIRSLSEANLRLNEKLKAYADESDGTAPTATSVSPAPSASANEGLPGAESPVLPSRPQKIETH